MKTKLLIMTIAVFLFTACQSKNDYDYHAGDSSAVESTDSEPDTIMGRAPDSTDAVRDTSNTGVGDTTLEQTH